MTKTLWAAVACTVIAASAAPVRAQQTPPATDTAAASTHAMPAAAGQDMAAQHANMMDVQKSAVAAATRAGTLSRASKLDRAAIATEATTARDDLQTVVKHLQDAEANAADADKAHIAQVRAHEEEALKHAEELLQAAQKPDSKAAELGMHAKAVVDHANAAETTMASHD